jgi:acyl-CoA dehydrogenase
VTADPLLVETVERLFADVATQEQIEHAEAAGWSAPIWSALAEAGFPWVGIADDRGGSGGTLDDVAAILRAQGRAGAPAPLAETAMIGGWLMSEAGLALPAGPVTAVDGRAKVQGGRLLVEGTAAWGRFAERIVVAAGHTVFALEPAALTIVPGANLAGEPRDHVGGDVAIAGVEHAHLDGVDAWTAIRDRGALSRVVLAAGALETVMQMTIDYTNERRQFGKPVATFQAVQSHLVTAAQCAVTARMAADVAVRALAAGSVGIEIAAARVVMDDAITAGTRSAHQAHGAMGVTREYRLHQLTRRLWAWRHEWGTTRGWRRQVGHAAVTRGADALFDLITS